MTEQITRFVGQYAFLNNFYVATFYHNKISYKTVEHAYQALKTLDQQQQQLIINAKTPQIAKQLGRLVMLREDWNDIKTNIMKQLIHEKFNNPLIEQLLLDTKNAELINNNLWHDTFWGVYNGVGKNMLGILLMQEREERRCKIIH